MDQATARLILLVDDNQDDLMLIERALAYLRGEYPYTDRGAYPVPDLVLLDIKMPGTDGFEVLRWIRQQKEFSELCVVMLTSSDEIRDVNRAYQLGANSFLVKPLDFGNAGELWRSLQRVLASRKGSMFAKFTL